MVVFMIMTLLLVDPITDTAPSEVSIKFKKHENSMVAKATLNGRGPFSFVLDTGAAMTVISAETAAKAGLKPSGDEIMLVGVGGKPVRGHLAEVREISLGGAKARRMDVVIYQIPQLNKQQISGLIGQDFLERFDLRFDNRRKILTLSLPESGKARKVEKKPLGLIEQMARKVYEDPISAFDGFHEITRRAQDYYNLCATGAPPEHTALEDFEAMLYHNRKRMNQLYQHLLNQPFHELKSEWNANAQKFLYCWPTYRTYIDEALALSQQLKSDDVHWEQAASRIETITSIAARFGCKPPIATPAWLEETAQ